MIRERPLLIPFWAMASGLVISHATGCSVGWSPLVAALCCLLLSLVSRTTFVFAASLALFFFLWGMQALGPWLSSDAAIRGILPADAGEPQLMEGVVVSRPQQLADGGSLLLRVERLFEGAPAGRELRCRLLVNVAHGELEAARGDRIRLRARIAVPNRLGLPGEFDYRRYLALQGVAGTARVAEAAELVLVRGATEAGILRFFDRLAARMAARIRAALPEERISSVLVALLVGDQKRVPQELADAYSRAGVSHILSISGFHIGIITAFLAFTLLSLLSRLEILALRFNLRRGVLVVALPAMLAYLVLTGAAPATARSVAMLAICVAALLAERETEPVNTLLMAGFLLVLLHPPTLFDLSFQLSFIALWGIIIGVPPMSRLCDRFGRGWQRMLARFVATSLAASLVTLVPLLFIFRQASINGIISNLVIVPLMGYGAVLAGFCGLPAALLVPQWAPVILWPAAELIRISNVLIEQCARLPLIRSAGVGSADMALFLILLCALTFWRGRGVRLAALVLVPVLALSVRAFARPANDGRLHISMLSVGQAESLLVRFPGGKTMLVDGGGYLHDNGRDFGRQVLMPALNTMGIDRLDILIATHGHPDHTGGLPYVAARLPVGEFWRPAGHAPGMEPLLKVVADSRVPSRQLATGDRLTLPDGVVLEVLSPRATPPGNGTADDIDEAGENERSLVFRLVYRDFSMLFAADAGFDAECRILERAGDLRSTVLKVGHHGSRYSTSDRFLDRVRPAVALISAGAGNRFGLPARETIVQLAQRKIPVYRTDRDGTIELASDGHAWDVATPYAVR